MDYTENDFVNLSAFKLYSQHVRPLITARYPKLSTQKVMTLMAAYWREFLELKGAQHASGATSSSHEHERADRMDVDETRSTSTGTPPPSANRSRRRRGLASHDENEADESLEQARESEENSPARKSSATAKKLPSLKIKLQKDQPATPVDREPPTTSAGNIDDEEIKAVKKSSRQRKRKRRDDDDPSNESDAEFEAMLVQSELTEEEEVPKKKRVKKPPKPPKRIARLNNRRSQAAADDTLDVSLEQGGYETDHQDYCEVCQQGGEIILCDTCPKAYHLVCLDPELEQAPEGDWSCPECTKNGISIRSRQMAAARQAKVEDDNHMEFCRVCRDGGELLCCDQCPSSYHMHCLIPPMTVIPDDDWFCPRCTVSHCLSKFAHRRLSIQIEPPPYVVKKILTWRWITHPIVQVTGKDEKKAGEDAEPTTAEATPSVDDEATEADVKQRLIPSIDPNLPPGSSRGPFRTRELFVKYDGLSYWSCEWLPELQVEVHQSSLWRCYIKKIGDSQQPPATVDAENEGEEDDEVSRRYYNPKLEQRYYKNGVRPEWLCVHRILNHQKEKGSVTQYLVKWRELGYEQATWELEKDGEHTHLIENWQKAIDDYWKLRYAQVISFPCACLCFEIRNGPDGEEKKKKKTVSSKVTRHSHRQHEENRSSGHGDSADENESSGKYPPPRKRYEEQPDFINVTGGTLHPYQLEGLNWLRFSFSHNTDVILADEMGLGKTIQTIVFLQALLKEGLSRGPFLISAPLATIINWEREFEYWAPDMYVVTYTGDKEARSVIRKHEFSFEGKRGR